MEKKETAFAASRRDITPGTGFPAIHEKMPIKHSDKEEKSTLFDFLFGGTDSSAADAGHSGVFLNGGNREKTLSELKAMFRQKAEAAAEEESGRVTEAGLGENLKNAASDGDIPDNRSDVDVPSDNGKTAREDSNEAIPQRGTAMDITLDAQKQEQKQEDAGDATEDLPAGFGRDSVSTEAIRRSTETEEPEEEEEVRTEGYMPPLPLDYTPNMQIPLDDCIYSMFIGEICEAEDPKKYEIYFMVAPFEIRENEPSCNILMYAYFKNQNYSVTSPLTNDTKNSILCQIAEFQFLIRGSFKDGVWSSDIQLTGTSLRRNDVFDIKKIFHHNAEKPGGNGHIRFTYDGYINHKEITSVGSVDVFPMDSTGRIFVVVRCMEDFTDIFYTDEPVPVELKTADGCRILSVSMEEKNVTAKLENFMEAGGEAGSE